MRIRSHSRLCLLLLLTLAVRSRGADEDRATLLEAQVEGIVHMLHMGNCEMAAEHLDVLRKEFPTRADLVDYYAAVIEYERHNYAKAALLFRELLNGPNGQSGRESNLCYLFRAYYLSSQFDKAQAVMAETIKKDKDYKWLKDAPLELGRALYQKSTNAKDSSQKSTLQRASFDLLLAFIKEHPDHPGAAWIRFVETEHDYSELEPKLTKLQSMAQGESREEIISKANQLVKQYHAILRTYPDAPEAAKAQFRKAYLIELLTEKQ